ncbi:sensor histidine kinase [Massilia sp. CCM 8734]|uniref:sensor histidine kinase n=1 Tax=Massilia sp. CCM 8734 TaxID=2609283 RepID=UPI00141FF2C4|nr:histidine kinase [Massilia sp. CCM 8734]NHZ95932.1 sensor histidine kinase [Massilia sp. CCM 8734]
MEARRPPEQAIATVLAWLHRAFDATATWVTQLSWWKFFLFAALALIAASILQNELFSGGDVVEVRQERKRDKREGNIIFDDSGISYSPPKKRSAPPEPAEPPEPPEAAEPPEPPQPPEPPGTAAHTGKPAVATVPDIPPAPSVPDADGEVRVALPPQIVEGLSSAIEAAVENAAEEKVKVYHGQASTWFKSFISLLVLALFATKALVGGKKRAEAETQTANAAAERESMQRQLSEARMQMMQAQVEPHFLFNTLASVEYLIETDPPRASAMQRSLIQYLRAVLPQMRDNAVVTNLGREADMVKAYLSLLKMRMEERLQVDLRIPDGLRSAAFPPMMLQSMVENAIKHGLECKPEGGSLSIVAEVAHNKLRVIVSDDGVGFGVFPSDGTGLGLMTIRERLKLLHGDAGQLHIAANTPSGVIATIEVPYQVSK